MLNLLKLKDPIQIVDIGANPIDGTPPYKVLMEIGACEVTGFEPQLDALEKLNSVKSDIENYLPIAVGDGKQHTLHIYQSSGLASLLELDPASLEIFQQLKPVSGLIKTIPIATSRLDDISEIKKIDFLKIDIQGSELMVFRNGREKLKNAICIQTEVSFVSLYKNQPSIGEVDLELRSLGFIPHSFPILNTGPIAPIVFDNDPWKGKNQLGEADIVYVKDFRKPELIDDESLKKLAIIAHHCYQSFDLAGRCIMLLAERGSIDNNGLNQYLDLIKNPTLNADKNYYKKLQLAQHYETLNNFKDAELIYRNLIKDNPQKFDAYNMLTHMLTENENFSASEQLWSDCITALPNDHAPKMFQALAYISHGKIQEGFKLRDPCVSDARRTPIVPPTTYPRWQGESLQGKSIVIWTEFGFGDEIMFARFVSVFKQELKASHVSIVCQDAIHSILQTLKDADLVISDTNINELPSHNYWVFPHSIPVHHSFEYENIPTYTPYIFAKEDDLEKWSHLVRKKPNNFKVGLTWKGNSTHENDTYRSVHDISTLAPLLSLEGVDFYNLQKGSGEDDLNNFENIIHINKEIKNYSDTAALVSLMDVIICVDTSVAHLAGAMNKKTYLLLPKWKDWRWFINKKESPWYPSMEIFEQKKLGDWNSVVDDIIKKLNLLKNN